MHGVIQKIDLRILDDKYVNLFGVDKINYISCFPKIVDQLLGLSENEFKALEIGYSKYFEKNDTKDWYFIFNKMLGTIVSESEYGNSIYKKTSDYSKVDSDCLIKVLLNSFDNMMIDFDNIDEINNINEKIKKYANYLSKKDDIDKCREAVLLKFFGIPSGDESKAFGMNEIQRKGTKWLLKAYGDGLDELEEGPYKNMLKIIKLIYEIDDIKTLKMLYKSRKEFSSIDIVEAESAIKKEYLKVYNKSVLKPDELPVNEEGLYEAGTDFKIIMTVLGAYSSREGDNIENYENDWNRDSLASLHFCTSLISNDMIATSPRKKGSVCYGFANLNEDSLLLAGSKDIYTSDHRTFGISNHEEWSKDERTVQINGPDKMVEKTGDGKYLYNEMCFKRSQHGATENNPDYIIVFKEYGKIDEESLENSRKAAKDFGGIPIVVVDIDKCLEAERKKLDNLIDEYKIDGDMAKLEQISHIIKNNRHTRNDFAMDIDLEAIEKNWNQIKLRKR